MVSASMKKKLKSISALVLCYNNIEISANTIAVNYYVFINIY